VTTGRGLPVTSQERVTGSPFFTTRTPLFGIVLTLGGTVIPWEKKKKHTMSTKFDFQKDREKREQFN
jgi:hypothetical protein